MWVSFVVSASCFRRAMTLDARHAHGVMLAVLGLDPAAQVHAAEIR